MLRYSANGELLSESVVLGGEGQIRLALAAESGFFLRGVKPADRKDSDFIFLARVDAKGDWLWMRQIDEARTMFFLSVANLGDALVVTRHDNSGLLDVGLVAEIDKATGEINLLEVHPPVRWTSAASHL